MDTQQIDVMVADASHEVYVTLFWKLSEMLPPCEETGIAERTHEYVATK